MHGAELSTATHNIHQNSAGNKSAAQGDQTMGTARKKAGVFQKQGVDKKKDNKTAVLALTKTVKSNNKQRWQRRE